MKLKTCKICKTKYEPLRPLQVVCSPKCGYEYMNKQKQKEWKQRKKKLKEELITVQDLMKLAQIAFNAYIRERDKGKDCISCGKPLTGKFDAGHYVSSGSCKALTFDEDNVNGQCVTCNQHLHGNLIKYRQGILKRYNERTVKRLENHSHDVRKYTRNELKAITKEYKDKLKQLKLKK